LNKTWENDRQNAKMRQLAMGGLSSKAPEGPGQLRPFPS
jgi:hypothetical protein